MITALAVTLALMPLVLSFGLVAACIIWGKRITEHLQDISVTLATWSVREPEVRYEVVNRPAALAGVEPPTHDTATLAAQTHHRVNELYYRMDVAERLGREFGAHLDLHDDMPVGSLEESVRYRAGGEDDASPPAERWNLDGAAARFSENLHRAVESMGRACAEAFRPLARDEAGDGEGRGDDRASRSED